VKKRVFVITKQSFILRKKKHNKKKIKMIVKEQKLKIATLQSYIRSIFAKLIPKRRDKVYLQEKHRNINN